MSGPAYDGAMGVPEPELQRLVEEQTALRALATLVASGPSEADLVAAVTSEIAGLFGADTASTLRWDGETIRVIGSWRASERRATLTGRDFAVGGDTIATRVVRTGAPARIDSADDLETDFARARWESSACRPRSGRRSSSTAACGAS